MECVVGDSASTNFIKSGNSTRFADWRFIHRARLNLVPLNGSSTWRTSDRRCRQCRYIKESLFYVVKHCILYTALYLARHNTIVAGTRYQVISENPVVGSQRPHAPGSGDQEEECGVHCVDVTIPFNN
ncbi:Hypothetical protein CINCED_3A019200 [Cinara cedri]|uniref:Uncharacterized protein n=1 Tax=Cinara cedri TaxID=506608 RepID=A0A5E4NLK2_9HEMI|nr:Hypothetical protein CINCED_3A019200 [Cinara cedri]